MVVHAVLHWHSVRKCEGVPAVFAQMLLFFPLSFNLLKALICLLSPIAKAVGFCCLVFEAGAHAAQADFKFTM